MIAVRLTEIRPEVRVSAALKLAEREPQERQALILAALQPSNTTYYLSNAAWPLVVRYAA